MRKRAVGAAVIPAVGTEAELVDLVRKDEWALKRIPVALLTPAIAVAAFGSNVHAYGMLPPELGNLAALVREVLGTAQKGFVQAVPGSALASYIERNTAQHGAEGAMRILMNHAAAEVPYEVEKRIREAKNMTRILMPAEDGKMDTELEALLERAKATTASVATTAKPDDVRVLRHVLLEISVSLFKASLDKEAIAVRAAAQGLAPAP